MVWLFEDIQGARAEVRCALPAALLERIDWETLAALPERFVDEVMQGSHADRDYQVQYEQGGQGRNALVHVLWEHKSEVDKWTLLQLLRYMVRV